MATSDTIPIHLLWYLAERLCGEGDYHDWVWVDGLPWSRKLHREIVTRGRRLPGCLPRLSYTEAVIAARLLHALELYPPVDDPVEYILVKYPLLTREEVERVWRRIEGEEDLRRALRVHCVNAGRGARAGHPRGSEA